MTVRERFGSPHAKWIRSDRWRGREAPFRRQRASNVAPPSVAVDAVEYCRRQAEDTSMLDYLIEAIYVFDDEMLIVNWFAEAMDSDAPTREDLSDIHRMPLGFEPSRTDWAAGTHDSRCAKITRFG